MATEVEVETYAKWADFVFEPNYQLMPLSEVEQYIIKNKHLPNIPSAKEVEEKGFKLAEMDAKLLQSVEELTLHVIEQNKAIEKLIEQNKAQQEKINQLEKKVGSK